MHAIRVALVILIGSGVFLTTGCSSAASESAKPSAPGPAFFFTPSSPVVGQAVTFADASTGAPSSWSWSFGDGGTSTVQSPTHVYTAAGTFTITLTVANAGGSAQATRTVTVTPAAPSVTASFAMSPTAPVAGQSVTFVDTSTGAPTRWSWTFGDGGTSTQQNPQHAFAAAGTYTVTLTAASDKGSSTATQSVTVKQAGTSTFVLSSSAGKNGETLPIECSLDGSGSSPDLAWSGVPAGTKELALLMTTLPGDGSTLWNWVLYRLPASTTSLPKAASGLGTPGMTSHSVLGYAPPQSTGPGAKKYTFTVYALSGSPSLPSDANAVTGDVLTKAMASLVLGSASLDLNYTRSAPTAAFTATVTGSTAAFTSTVGLSATSLTWTFGDGASSTEKNPTHTYTASGTYPVTLKVANAFGTNTVTRSVVVALPNSAPVAGFLVAPGASAAGQMVAFVDLSTGAPTAWSWTFGDGGTSTLQHPNHTYTASGSYPVTLTVRNSYGTHTSSQTVTLGAAVPSTAKMNMAQTISDQAQRTTLAFSGLAMITGNVEAQSFYPPGKVADYTAFQFLRDNDPSDMGHNTSFLTRVANNVISILSTDQLKQLAALATSQQQQFDLYGYKRFPLMKAFRRLMDGDIPTGSSGLNLNAVKKASRELYRIDGQISYDRALLYATIYRSLSASQKSYLDAMVGKGWSAWPDVPDSIVRDKLKDLPQGINVAVMTYASDIFSWYACGVEGDVYFCPERQGTYYGGFYIKDAPAIGHEGYSIDQQLTATAGAALCDASKGYVTASQATLMSSLVETQRTNLYSSPTASIVGIRTEIATLLRALRLSTANADAIQARVLALSETYGDLDGANNHAYATVFAQVAKTLTTEQKAKLMDLRKSIMSGKYADGTPFDFTLCTTPFLYSAVIKDLSVLAPYLSSSDALFFEP